MWWERNVCPNSPPRLGGVAAPPRKCSRSLLAQTGWYGMARSHVIDTRVALLIQSVRFANIYKVVSHHGSTTPPFAKKRANGTPPNLGGEFFAHLEECPNSSPPCKGGVNASSRSVWNAFRNISSEMTTPSAPSKVASQHFLVRRNHASRPRRGIHYSNPERHANRR